MRLLQLQCLLPSVEDDPVWGLLMKLSLALICRLEEYTTPLAEAGAMDTTMKTSWLAFHRTPLSTTGVRERPCGFRPSRDGSSVGFESTTATRTLHLLLGKRMNAWQSH